MALSATIPPAALTWIHRNLHLHWPTQLVKESIDRPNIFLAAAPIRSPIDSYKDLDFLIPDYDPEAPWNWHPSDVEKTMVFMDSIAGTQKVVRHLKKRLPQRYRNAPVVRAYSSILSEETRDNNMKAFMDGKLRIMVCTDAAGMGVDIKDVVRVVQYKTPVGQGFDTLWQRFGRCARDAEVSGVALLLYEKDRVVPGLTPQHGSRALRKGLSEHPYAEFRRPAVLGCEDFAKNLGLMKLAAVDCQNSQLSGRGGVALTKLKSLGATDPSILWYTSSIGCRRQVVMFLMDDEKQGQCERCDNCDRCLKARSEDPDSEVLGVLLSTTTPYNPVQIHQHHETHGLVSTSTQRQAEHIQLEIARWSSRRYAEKMAEIEAKYPGTRTSKYVPALPDDWLLNSEHISKLAKYCNEITTIERLEAVLQPQFSLQRSILGEYAEKLVVSLRRLSKKRPPTPPPLIPATPSQTWIRTGASTPIHQLTPKSRFLGDPLPEHILSAHKQITEMDRQLKDAANTRARARRQKQKQATRGTEGTGWIQSFDN
jgi:superfamily II DNA helicase RecQ